MRLQYLARRRGHRHRHVPFAAELEAEIEILAQELRREGGGPVEIDQRRGLVGGEHRAHHAVVHEGEEGMARHAHLVGEQRDFDQVLDHHAEHDVVRDLADAREFAVADIGHAARREHLDQRHRDFGVGLGAGHHGRQLAGLDHLGIAGHRCGQETHAFFGQALADGGGFLNPDRRAVDNHARQLAAGAQAVLAERTCSTSLPVETIANTTSQPASSTGLSTILPPLSASGSALARVRFQIDTSWPALSRRSAMGVPMRPTPIQPIFVQSSTSRNSR